MLTFREINDATGFANGAKFTDEDDVRAYFAIDCMRDMCGDEQAVCELNQATLDEMADAVIANRWHMSN